MMCPNDNRWTRAAINWIPRYIQRIAGREPFPWLKFFTKTLEGRYDGRGIHSGSGIHYATLAHDKDIETLLESVEFAQQSTGEAMVQVMVMSNAAERATPFQFANLMKALFTRRSKILGAQKPTFGGLTL